MKLIQRGARHLTLAAPLGPLIGLWLDRSLFVQEGGVSVAWKGLRRLSPVCSDTAVGLAVRQALGLGRPRRPGEEEVVDGAGGKRGQAELLRLRPHQGPSQHLPESGWQRNEDRQGLCAAWESSPRNGVMCKEAQGHTVCLRPVM